MTKENLTVSDLDKFYKPLATSIDDGGLEFIATIEAINYPFWGLQFHPEKNVYEWGANITSVPHWPSAVRAGLYFADFFVNQGDLLQKCLFKIVQKFNIKLHKSPKESAPIRFPTRGGKLLNLQLHTDLHGKCVQQLSAVLLLQLMTHQQTSKLYPVCRHAVG